MKGHRGTGTIIIELKSGGCHSSLFVEIKDNRFLEKLWCWAVEGVFNEI